MLVLVLMTVAPPRTGAVPVPEALRALPGARGCHLAQFKSLSPQALQAFKRAKDAFVSLLKPPCGGLTSTHNPLLPRPRGVPGVPGPSSALPPGVTPVLLGRTCLHCPFGESPPLPPSLASLQSLWGPPCVVPPAAG